jgi:hypothetical protein
MLAERHSRRPKAGQGSPKAASASRARTKAPKSIIAALSDPDLFGGMFDAESWTPWRAFLSALWALPLSPEHLALYRRHTGRSEPPTKPARYAELVVGRRGGKSRVLALIAAYLACVVDHRPYTVPGETPVVAIIAKDRTQARVILSYIRGFLREIALFAELIEDELAESIRLSNVSLSRCTQPRSALLVAAPSSRSYAMKPPSGLLRATAPTQMSKSSTQLGPVSRRFPIRCF